MSRLVSRQLLLLAIAALFLSIPSWAAQPQIVSLSPSSGSGQTQTFTLAASDTSGASDIASIDMLINSAFNKDQACWLYFDNNSGLVSLADDNGGWYGSPIGTGSSRTLGNSRCTVQFISYSDSGDTVTFTVSITFSSAWLGAKTIWGESLDQAKDDSGYQQVGTYAVVHEGPTQDFSVSATPSHLDTTPGHTVTYNFTLTSINGFSGNIGCTATADPQPSGLLVLLQGTPGPLPANGTQTGQIVPDVSSSTPPTSNITITLACQDNNLQHSTQVTLNIAAPETPTVSISPISGSGATQTFTIAATDPGGFTAIGQINFLIGSSFDGSNACWLYYQANSDSSTSPPSGTLALASDDASNWSNTTLVDSNPNDVTPIFNSQCSVFGGPTTVSGSGDTLTLSLTLTFTSSFTGSRILYLRAADAGGPDSGYQQLGTFTTFAGNGSPDFSLNVTPASQSVNGQSSAKYSVVVKGVYGYSDTVSLSVSGLPPDSTLTPPSNIGANQSTTFAVNTTGTTPTGSYTLTVTGTDGSLTHSQTAVLNVQEAEVPTLSASPNSGSGTTQSFTFTASDADGTTPLDLNILFNTSVNGSHACWVYYGQHGLALASDDGTLWESGFNSTKTMQNSQCTVTWTSTTDGVGPLGLTATIQFTSAFTGAKNIYMHADNAEGGDTGYQLQGSWTIP